MKKFLSLICVISLSISLTACNYASVQTTYDPEDETLQSMFIEIERSPFWRVVYHKETKVMYAVSDGGYNQGTFTLLVDENDNPMIYKEEK